MELLRQRAGVQRRRKGGEDDLAVAVRAAAEAQEREREQAEAGPSTLTNARGHINLFEDLERVRPRSLCSLHARRFPLLTRLRPLSSWAMSSFGRRPLELPRCARREVPAARKTTTTRARQIGRAHV